MRAIAIIIIVLNLSGCADKFMESPNYGDSYRAQLQAQKLNPEPVADTPVEGLDGRLAAKHVEKYAKPKEDNGPAFVDVITSLMKKK